MGNIVQGLFGGSRQRSESNNQAFNLLRGPLFPVIEQTGQAGNALGKLLGGDRSGLDAFQRATGFNALAERGSRGITNNAAAGGLLRSGGSAMGLQRFGQELQDQSSGQYLDRLFGMGEMGLRAGQVLSGAGQRSTSTGGSQTGGAGKGIGKILSTAAKKLPMLSDPRVKTDIVKIGTMSDGLHVYEYRYNWENKTAPLWTGVMADEVAKLRPWALGPKQEGYLTVDYSKLFEKDG